MVKYTQLHSTESIIWVIGVTFLSRWVSLVVKVIVHAEWPLGNSRAQSPGCKLDEEVREEGDGLI